MKLLRDLTGAVIPAGRVTRTLIGPPVGTTVALPAWLAATVGAGTLAFPTNPNVWGLQLTTGTIAADQAMLAANFTLDSTLFRAIRWTVEAWQFDSTTTGPTAGATATIAVRNAASTAGVSMFGTTSTGNPTFRVFNPTGNISTTLEYSWSGVEAGKRRSLTLDLRPIARRIYVLENDQVVHAADVSTSFVDGDLIPQLIITNTTGGPGRWWRAAQVRLDLVHN